MMSMVAPAPVVDLSAWERHVVLPDGHAVFIRPIRGEDEVLYERFLAGVTAEDRRLRFFAPVNALSHARIAAFTHLDYAIAMAFIALDQASGEMLGVARLHDIGNDIGNGSAEYAVVVRSDLKSHGLGWLLMQLTIDYARAKGLQTIEGKVLCENRTMLDMSRQLGFHLTADPLDASIVTVTLKL
jgi:acetyltransferase